MSEDVLLARAYLSRIVEPTCFPIWELVRDVGPVEAAARIRAGAVGDQVRAMTAPRLGSVDADADLAAADRYGLRLVVPESEDWPHFGFAPLEQVGAALLRKVPSPTDASRADLIARLPPLALWVKGPADLLTLGVRSAGIVGARAATDYGVRIASDLAYGLARNDVPVVSGGAYGIDAAAHRGALAAEGVTVLISAGGLDKPYPPGNERLFRQVAERGLLISESPPGAAPQRHRFLSRNRLIAALSSGTVVVEGASRSGARNTAGHAVALGRPLMAVPGSVKSAMSSLCHDLLRTGQASLVAGVEDVLELVGSIGEQPAPEPDPPQARRNAAPSRNEVLDQLDPTARRVFDGIPARRSVRVDEISLTSGLGVSEVLRSLPVLELAGLVASDAGGYRIAPMKKAAALPYRVVP